MEQKADFGKFIQLSKVLKVITNIVHWISVIAGGITLSAGLLIFAFRDRISALIDDNLPRANGLNVNIGMISIKFDSGVVEGYQFVTSIILILLSATVSLVILFFITKHLRNILANVVAKKPFSADSAKQVRYLGFWVMGSSLLSGLGDLNTYYMFRMLDLETLITNAGHFSLKYNINIIDMNILFVGFLILLLSRIFQYGNYLQEEFDATV